MNGTLYYLPDPLITNLWSFPPPDAVSGDTLLWNFTNFLSEDELDIILYDSISPSVPLNTVLNSSAWITPVNGDSVPADNFSAVMDTVVGSFDPNDKTPDPKGTGPTGLIPASQEITYTIRFQNTGSFYAEKVEVIDTVDTDLDLSTFKMISSSHQYTYQILSSNRVIWTFDQIMLPDSNTNEPASHGFIKFSIKPLINIQLGAQITNTAYINFDFNAPVITNTTLNTISSGNFVITQSSNTSFVNIYPNPTISGKFTIETKGDLPTGQAGLEIYNTIGEIVFSQKIISDKTELDLSNKPKGIYFIKIISEDKTYSRKIIIQ